MSKQQTLFPTNVYSLFNDYLSSGKKKKIISQALVISIIYRNITKILLIKLNGSVPIKSHQTMA